MRGSKLRFLVIFGVLISIVVINPFRFKPLAPATVNAMDLVRVEARVDQAVSTYGVTGSGVLIATIDRGIDWQNDDFRNPDGTTRIEYIFDLTDNTGAGAPGNPYGVGTIYTKAQINAALQGGPTLATRDAVGHGSTTAGIIAGNGRHVNKYRGVAPNAGLIVVKVVAGSTTSTPPEATFNNTLGVLPTAIDFVRDKALELNKPCVMLANIGSQQGPTDGTSSLCQKIDSTVGPGHPGLVFVSGPGDDGGMPNRCGGTVTQGGTSAIQIQKGNTGNLRFDLWYSGNDRFDISLQTPLGNFGPYASPATNSNSFSVTAGGCTLSHQGSNVDFFGSTNGKRELLIDISGTTGTYTINLIGATVTNGRFDGIINPSQKFNSASNLNQFLTFTAPGSIWDGATAMNNICPSDYVVRTNWTDIDGIARSQTTQGSLGAIWQGASVGPTFDGRLGVDLCAPGDSLFSVLSPNSGYSVSRFNMIQDGLGFYVRQSAVSAAAPVVTGIIALMLQRNRNLDAVTIRNLLRTTARADSFTGTVPNNTWGYGKVDALAAVGAVTPAASTLEHFTAVPQAGSVLLEWQTGLEVDNLGFNIYRETDGVRRLITSQLIAGSALTDGPGTSLLSGHSYHWADVSPRGKNIRYWLEDVDLNGKSTFNGPFVISNTKRSPGDKYRRSELLSQIGLRQALIDNSSGSTALLRTAMPLLKADAELQTQSEIASRPAIKIAVKQEGYYRVTQPDLVRVGLDPRVDPRLLKLFADGIEQPITVKGSEDGRFDPADAIEFYGLGLDTPSTDTRVYWLTTGGTPGKRIPVVQGKGGVRTSSGSFPFTTTRQDRTIYFSSLRNGDAENFFGSVITSQPVDQSLWIQHLNVGRDDQTTVEVSVQGVTSTAHSVRVQLNGTEITRMSFEGQTRGMRVSTIPTSLLREGENIVTLAAEGGPSDINLVDSISITYPHSYVADTDLLTATLQSGESFSISGFSSKDVRLADVTDSNSVAEITGAVSPDKSGYTIRGSIGGIGSRRLLAFTNATISHPLSVTANLTSSWRQSGNAADLVIITPREYFGDVEPLKAARQKQGLSVAVADVEDIYDEFNFGNKSPQAIRDFCAYAGSNWRQAPRFLILAGDGSYDPRNHLGLGFDLIPTKLIDTDYLETASDDWFADFDDDGVADLAVGRLPFRTEPEASAMIAKILAYDQSSPSDEALLVADANDGFDFELASAELGGTLPTNIRVNFINRGIDGASAKTRLMEAINRGQKLINYDGHGSANRWRGDLLMNEDASHLTNAGHLSLFVMMTCLNGYFDDPTEDSLAESLMKTQTGGAVAVWASSGMTLPAYQVPMNQEFYRLLFGGRRDTLLGDAIRGAKSASSNIDVRRTWVLLGDPTTRIK